MASREVFEKIYRGYGKLLAWLAVLAGFAFFGMMLLIDVNAIMRKFLNRPVTGTLEITEALMPAAVLLSLAFTQYTRTHIRVTLAIKHFSPGVQRALFVIAVLLGCAFMIWFTWASWGYAMRSFQANEHAWGTIRFPIYPSKMVVPVGTALLAIQFLLDAIRTGIFGIEDAEEDAEIGSEAAVDRGV